MIRKMHPDEYGLLKGFLYDAVYRPEGTTPPPIEIVNHPTMRIYYDAFGSERSDIALCAETDSQIIGAIWCRRMHGYGFIRDGIPELAMAVKAPYRRQGTGRQLLHALLCELGNLEYEAVSLSVQKGNFASAMYRKAGFRIFRETEDEYIMIYEFR